MIAFALQEGGSVRWYDNKRRVINGRYGKLLSYTPSTVVLQEGATIYVLDEKGRTISSRWAPDEKSVEKKPKKEPCQERSRKDPPCEHGSSVGSSGASLGEGDFKALLWLTCPLWGPYWLLYKLVVVLIKMPFRGWFWKWVFPVAVMPILALVTWGTCADADSKCIKTMWSGTRILCKEQFIAEVQAGRPDQAIALLDGKLIDGYQRFLDERLALDDKIYVSRYFKPNPRMLVAGRVESLEDDAVHLRLTSGGMHLKVTASLKQNGGELKVGDYVLLYGIATALTKDSFILTETTVEHNGVSDFEKVF